MAITTTFNPPTPSDSPATFNTKAFDTLGKLNTWSSEANTLASDLSATVNPPSHRNRVINGAMLVDQRNSGAAQTFTAGAALAYCVDRFYGYCTGANITGQRIALSSGLNRYRFTGAASNTGVGFGTRLEAANTLDLAGKTAALQVKLSSSSLTAITWVAYYANTADTFGPLASPTRTQIATGSFTINSTEATYSASISVPAAATTGIEVVFSGGALLGSQTLTIGDIQLEAGNVTPFERRPIGLELSLCQRYYEVHTAADHGEPAAYFDGTSAYTGYRPFQAVKRALPTMVVSYSAAKLAQMNGVAVGSVSSVGASASSTSYRISLVGTFTVAADAARVVHIGTSSITATAEL